MYKTVLLFAIVTRWHLAKQCLANYPAVFWWAKDELKLREDVIQRTSDAVSMDCHVLPMCSYLFIDMTCIFIFCRFAR